MWAALFDSTGRNLVTSSMDETVRLWESFPWKDADYQDPPGAPFAERVRLYAREYWRKQVARSNAAAESASVAASTHLPLGIPEWERERWLQRDPALGPEQINLDKSYTGVLDAILFPSGNDLEWDDDLSELPSGRQRFGGVFFDVRGVVWLHTDPARNRRCRLFTNRVDGIAVGRSFRKLHVLHAAVGRRGAKGYSTRPDHQDEGLLISSYIVNYADGNQHEFEVRYGRDLRNWWWGGHGDPEAEVDRGKVVWVGTNGTSRRYDAKVRLFISTFENPRPEMEVVSVDFVSRTPRYAPFLVAMTVEP
jgi:hypothetical protein